MALNRTFLLERTDFRIEVTVNEDAGTIESDLHEDSESTQYDAAIDGLESLILAHACAGVDVEAQAYVDGVGEALEAISNHHGE